MTHFVLGTFVNIESFEPEFLGKKDIEAALSAPEGFWAFKYDAISALVSVTLTPSNDFKNANPKSSKYRLRLWSGNEPGNMEENGVEEIMNLNLSRLPYKRPMTRVKLGHFFWFGIEKVKAGVDGPKTISFEQPMAPSSIKPGVNLGSETWSDLLQELEITTEIYTRLEPESLKWMTGSQRLQNINHSLGSVDQSAVAQGRKAERLRRDLAKLQGSIEEMRKVLSVENPSPQCRCAETAEANLGFLEKLKLQNENLILENANLQDDLNKLNTKIAANNVDIAELSETVYRLQCENDMLKDEGASEGDITTRGYEPRGGQEDRPKGDQGKSTPVNNKPEIQRPVAVQGSSRRRHAHRSLRSDARARLRSPERRTRRTTNTVTTTATTGPLSAGSSTVLADSKSPNPPTVARPVAPVSPKDFLAPPRGPEPQKLVSVKPGTWADLPGAIPPTPLLRPRNRHAVTDPPRRRSRSARSRDDSDGIRIHPLKYNRHSTQFP
ncbi:hypothetical protein TWF718_007369 [Orbilia javanica]|uniref:Uncharacterized protein n=1 Tax=Orbilia javanica TaxID=47235 RepID=A0AAN8MU60_9PEZI